MARLLRRHAGVDLRSFSLPLVLVCVFALPSLAGAQGSWFLEQHPYFDTLMAEPRGAQTSVLFPARADSFPFAVNEGSSFVWDINLGAEIPIVGYSTGEAGESPTGVAPGAFGIGVWFPLSFHMVEDMGKDPSNPILNTDYRFGGLVKAQWGLADNRLGWDSAHLGLKFQFGHESTHIGDEFTLGALRVHPGDFIRVNVSFEYWDLAGALEPNFGADGRHQVKLRAGYIWLWNSDKGWYSRTLLQPYGSFVAGSKRNHEPYMQFEWYRAPADTSRLGWIASADLRNRTVHAYTPAPDEAQTNDSEETEWSSNLMAGVRQVRSGPGLFGKLTPTYFVRWYHGVNPNGPFRSQSGFDEFGFGVHFTF